MYDDLIILGQKLRAIDEAKNVPTYASNNGPSAGSNIDLSSSESDQDTNPDENDNEEDRLQRIKADKVRKLIAYNNMFQNLIECLK